MKCLSVSQPYADLIIQGKKTIELRSWNTKFRGEFLVHAPKKTRPAECKRLGVKAEGLRTGVIIGRVELYDVKKYKTARELKSDYKKHLAGKEYHDRAYGFLLRKPKELKFPIPYKGTLGFFEVSIDSMITENQIKAELFDEEHRYQWIGKH
ncbi:MAG TPA: ASCH domain-containing protein [Candidatus Nitrosotalea sp.]|nr:ASCH domain-containing protein [Candidatus Nitrosotalea sp.]